MIGISTALSIGNPLYQRRGTAATTAPTTDTTSYTFAGSADDWSLTTAAPFGSYYLGEPFMLSTVGTAFDQTGTPSAADVNGRVQRGVVDAIDLTTPGNSQGLDKLIEDTVKSADFPYSSALNKDVTAAGTNYALSIGDEKTLIKAERRAGVGTDTFGLFDRIDALTIVPSGKHPNVGDFRPPMMGADKTSFVNVSDISRGCCQQIDVSSLIGVGTNDCRAYADVLADWRNPLASFGEAMGEQRRLFEVLTHVSSTNYAADLAKLMWETGIHLHNAALSDADWLALAAQVVQAAIDICGSVEAGQVEAPGEGQKHFYHAVLLWAAALTGNARLYSASQTMQSNVDQPLRLTSGDVGGFTRWPFSNQGGLNQYVQPRLTEDVGKPIWDAGGNISTATTSILQRQYLPVSGRGRLYDLVPFLAIKANSLGTGADILVAGDATREAMIQFLYREIATDGGEGYSDASGGNNYITSQMLAAFNLFEPYWDATPETTWTPDMPLPFTATAGSGQIAWDFSTLYAADYGSQIALSGMEVRVAQWSPVQFVTVSTSDNGTSAEVPGVPVYASARLQNANGWGPWSHSDKLHKTSTAPVNYVTPTGTASGTVTCATNPALMVKEYPSNSAARFVSATDNLDLGTPIYLGAGRWTGALSGTPTYAVEVDTGSGWVAGGGTITYSGHNSAIPVYEPVAGESGALMRVGVTVNGVTAYSSSITLGTIPAIPAGTLIDTDFGYGWDLQYSAFAATVASRTGSTLVENPALTFEEIDTSPGAIGADKIGQYPGVYGSFASVPAGTYRVEIEVPVGFDQAGAKTSAWLADGRVRLGTTFSGTDIALITIPLSSNGETSYLFSLDQEITLAATADLHVQILVFTNTGGGSGGDIFMSRLRITEA